MMVIRWVDAPGLSAGQLLDEILSIERLLRSLIERRLYSRHGADWRRRIPETIRERTTERRSSAKASWGPKRDGEVLALASLSELTDIILSRWQEFQEVLIDKQIFRAKMSELRLIRNALAHGEALIDEDKIKLVLLVRDLRERIPAVYSPHPPPSQRREAAAPVTAAVQLRPTWIEEFFDRLRSIPEARLDEIQKQGTAVAVLSLRIGDALVATFRRGQTTIAVVEGPGYRKITQTAASRDEARQLLEAVSALIARTNA